MNPMSAALEQRSSRGVEPPNAQAPLEAEGQDPLAALLASLAPDQKMKLMEMLQADLSASSEGEGESGKIENEAGETKVTEGEEAAMAAEMPNMGDSEIDQEQMQSAPRGLGDRLRASMNKHFPKK